VLSLTTEKLSTLSVDLACGRNFYNTILMEKFLNVFYEIYNKAKSCVKSAQGLSDFFISSTGVRQGKNLSPILFSIFFNDLISKEYSGLTTLTSSINTLLSNDTIDVYFKLYLLLYADDTVIFAESPEQLLLALDAMLRYCNLWKLSVNNSKTYYFF